jgi:large subunit ribosomal protein L20
MTPWDRKKYYKLAKGFYGRNKNCRRVMVPRVEKSLQYAYRDRRVKRRNVRRDWILSINAAVREHDINYSNFIYGLNRSNMIINRKILADLAVNEPYSFKAVIDEVKLNPNIKLKPKDEIPYMEALARGYIIQGPVKQKVQEELDVPILGYRNAEKLTPEQIEELKRM